MLGRATPKASIARLKFAPVITWNYRLYRISIWWSSITVPSLRPFPRLFQSTFRRFFAEERESSSRHRRWEGLNIVATLSRCRRAPRGKNSTATAEGAWASIAREWTFECQGSSNAFFVCTHASRPPCARSDNWLASRSRLMALLSRAACDHFGGAPEEMIRFGPRLYTRSMFV